MCHAPPEMGCVNVDTETDSSQFYESGIPLKEPPKYDDVVKEKQNHSVTDNHTQVVDELLDLLASQSGFDDQNDVGNSPTSPIHSDYETCLSDSVNYSIAPSSDDADDARSDEDLSSSSSSGVSSASSVFPDISAQPFLMLDDWCDAATSVFGDSSMTSPNVLSSTTSTSSKSCVKSTTSSTDSSTLCDLQQSYHCSDPCLSASCTNPSRALSDCPGSDMDSTELPDGLDFSDLLDIILPTDVPHTSTSVKSQRNLLDDIFGSNNGIINFGDVDDNDDDYVKNHVVSSSIEFVLQALSSQS
jgi:hypothetical protein